MKYIYLAIIMMLHIGQLFAEDTGYEVEIIIFEDTTGNYDHSEIWGSKFDTTFHNNTDETKIGTIKKSANRQAQKTNYEFLSNNKLRLNAQARKIEQHNDYNILYHGAWKQKGLDKDVAFPVIIDTRSLQNNENSHTVDSEKQLEGKSNYMSYIDGTMTLIMSRYLHINTNLVYHKPKAAGIEVYTNTLSTESFIELYDSYDIKSERRMRSREIHYLDHPLVGIIVMATPYKIEAKDSVEPADYKTL